MDVLLAGAGLARVPAQNNFGDTVPDGVAGPLGLFIIALMAIATVLLIRNMNARLRRLPASFPDPDAPAAPEPAGSDAPATGTADGTAAAGPPPPA